MGRVLFAYTQQADNTVQLNEFSRAARTHYDEENSSISHSRDVRVNIVRFCILFEQFDDGAHVFPDTFRGILMRTDKSCANKHTNWRADLRGRENNDDDDERMCSSFWNNNHAQSPR